MDDIWAYQTPWNALWHYGVKGMKWGVRKTPEQLRYDRLVRRGQKTVERYLHGPDGQIVITDKFDTAGKHFSPPQKLRPYAVAEWQSGGNAQINRAIYNGKGFVERHIHTQAHLAKHLDYGNGGAHAHEYLNGQMMTNPYRRTKNGKPLDGRELTELEVREHRGVLKQSRSR